MNPDHRSLRITRLELNNFKSLREVSFDSHRTLTLIRGPNEAGKTTVLDAVHATLCGQRAAPEAPIRKDQDSAHVQLTLSDRLGDRYRVTRSWTPTKSYLTVQDLSTTPPTTIHRPQSTLDELISPVTLDPLVLKRAKPSERLTLLLAALGQTAHYDRIQIRKRTALDAHHDAKREVAQLSRELASSTDPSPHTVLAPPNTKDLDAQIIAHQDSHDAYNAANSAFLNATQDEDRLTKELDNLSAALTAAHKRTEIAHHALTSHPKPDSTAIAALTETMHQSTRDELTQRTHRNLQCRLDQAQAATTLAHTELASIRHAITTLLSNSGLSKQVPGLELTEEGLLHNGVPFEQASSMRTLELSTLLAIATNPSIHILLIDEADGLDDASLSRLAEIAADHDYGIWMTAVRAGDTIPPANMTLVELDNGKQLNTLPGTDACFTL